MIEFVPLPQIMAPNRTRAQLRLLAEGTGRVRDLLVRNGFSELTTIRTFRWAPQGEPHSTRPIRPIGHVEYQDLLDRFWQKFDAEPEDSVTWIAGDLRRAGGLGQPEWDEPVVGDGDYAVNAPYDLRFGTFGNHHEDSLCVWGADLLAEVSDELDAVMPRLNRTS